MYKAVVSAKGQMVIPSVLRKKFGIKKGTQVCLYERDGGIVIKPITASTFRAWPEWHVQKGGCLKL